MTDSAASPAPLLAMSGIVKEFPGVRALDGVDLEVLPGEVHCLLGQNGAGKSTLIKVLAGAHQPDDGEIRWQGEPVTLSTPDGRHAARHRHHLPGARPRRRAVGRREHLPRPRARPPPASPAAATQNAAARALLAPARPPRDLGAGARSARLSAAGKQIVSMARALSPRRPADRDGRAVRGARRTTRSTTCSGSIRELTADGVAVVYISHRLEEIRAIGDRVTVLKDGRTVATGLPAAHHPDRARSSR